MSLPPLCTSAYDDLDRTTTDLESLIGRARNSHPNKTELANKTYRICMHLDAIVTERSVGPQAVDSVLGCMAPVGLLRDAAVLYARNAPKDALDPALQSMVRAAQMPGSFKTLGYTRAPSDDLPTTFLVVARDKLAALRKACRPPPEQAALKGYVTYDHDDNARGFAALLRVLHTLLGGSNEGWAAPAEGTVSPFIVRLAALGFERLQHECRRFIKNPAVTRCAMTAGNLFYCIADNNGLWEPPGGERGAKEWHIPACFDSKMGSEKRLPPGLTLAHALQIAMVQLGDFFIDT